MSIELDTPICFSEQAVVPREISLFPPQPLELNMEPVPNRESVMDESASNNNTNELQPVEIVVTSENPTSESNRDEGETITTFISSSLLSHREICRYYY